MLAHLHAIAAARIAWAEAEVAAGRGIVTAPVTAQAAPDEPLATVLQPTLF